MTSFRRSVTVLFGIVAFGLCACGGASTPAPAPTPSVVPLRPIQACPVSVSVPAESASTVPDPTAPPTVIVTTGGAISFQIPRGARIGLLGSDSADAAGLCSPQPASGVTATFVAVTAGYVRVGVQVGTQPVAIVNVRVTGA